MITYVYRYTDNDDNETTELMQSIKDDAYSTHPENGRPMERVPQVGNLIVDSKKPKTLATLAQKNTEEMIKRGDKRIKPKKKKERPFWRSDKDKPVDIRNKSKKQIKTYIETGKMT